MGHSLTMGSRACRCAPRVTLAHDHASQALAVCRYRFVIGILRCLPTASGRLGIRTFKTPLSKLASTLSSSTVSGRQRLDLGQAVFRRVSYCPRKLILKPNNGLLNEIGSQTSQIERRQEMTRMLRLATFSLAVTTLPLPAQTPSGPVQGAVQGTVKGTATVSQGVVQGAGQAGQGIARGSASVARGAGQATVGVARGAGTVAAKTGKGAWCIISLGYGC